MSDREIQLQPLTHAAFAPFGEVIEAVGQPSYLINDGQTERFHALSLATALPAVSDVNGQQGSVPSSVAVGMSIFRNQVALCLPFAIRMLERHPLGSQAFIPLAEQVFVIVVAKPLDAARPDEAEIYAFISNGQQGVNYHAGTWHHPLLTLEAPSDFLVVDRIGKGHNCDVYPLNKPVIISRGAE